MISNIRSIATAAWPCAAAGGAVTWRPRPTPAPWCRLLPRELPRMLDIITDRPHPVASSKSHLRNSATKERRFLISNSKGFSRKVSNKFYRMGSHLHVRFEVEYRFKGNFLRKFSKMSSMACNLKVRI